MSAPRPDGWYWYWDGVAWDVVRVVTRVGRSRVELIGDDVRRTVEQLAEEIPGVWGPRLEPPKAPR